MGVEPEKFLDEAAARVGITTLGVRAAVLGLYAAEIATAYLRFDAGHALLARVLAVAAPVLLGTYTVFRGVLAMERLFATWPGGEAGFRADQLAQQRLQLKQKRAEWERLYAGGRVRFVARKAPNFTRAIAPLVIGAAVLLVPAAAVPARAFPEAPRSVVFLGGAIAAAALIATGLALWDWVHSKRSWEAFDRA